MTLVWVKMDRGERTEAIRDGVARGLSTTQIAAEIKGCTRNAVIGHAHRWKIQLNAQHPVASAESKPKKGKKSAPAKRAKKPKTPKEMPPAKVEPAPPPLPDEHYHVHVSKVRDGQCRYPAWRGDAKRHPYEAYIFCGKPTKEFSRYCHDHHRITSDGTLDDFYLERRRKAVAKRQEQKLLA